MAHSPVAAQEAIFEQHTSGGEGRPVLIAKQDGLQVYSAPDLRSSVHLIPYRTGWLIPFNDTLLRTLQRGENAIVKSGVFDVRCKESGRERMSVRAGEIWIYLQYRAEGMVTAQIQGKICTLPAFIETEIFGEKILRPTIQWWVKVSYADGSSPGWLLVDDDQVKRGQRELG